MSKSTNLPVLSGSQAPVVVSGPVNLPVIDNALSALQSALSVGIEIARVREDGMTQRAYIAKRAEIEIAQLEF